MRQIENILPYTLPRINDKKLMDPHVVIIGAGASIAACNVDKNGLKVPVLKNIHKILELTDELKEYNFSHDEMEDFELLYSNIHNKSEFKHLEDYLERSVRNYFKRLTIPDTITYYDYLILSLTSKDVIISFNWDPFLIQAYKRNISVGNLPEIIFPHGNVGVGVCESCHTTGYANTLCTKCFHEFQDMPLLFPVGKKNYSQHSIIQFQWKRAREQLSQAAGITVFGYSAPETDQEAFELMKEAYTLSGKKEIAPFTIIDLQEKRDKQMEKWKELMDISMVHFTDNFEETILWRNPRVSLEYCFDGILQQHPREEKPYRRFSTLDELQNFVREIDEFDLYC